MSGYPGFGRWGVMDVYRSRSRFRPISAAGGNVFDIRVGNVLYRVHSFTTVGTHQFDVIDLGDSNGEVEYLAVAGGGGGGLANYAQNAQAGGGGGGGYRTSVFGDLSGGNTPAESPLIVSPQSYTITVGSGGARASSEGTGGFNGTPSSIGSAITTVGGGGGGGRANTRAGKSGGSGGGAGANASGGAGTAGQGFAGGNASGNNVGGGGGGAGGAGANSASNSGGGAGLVSSIVGGTVERGRGGNASTFSIQNGAANTGNGGGGGNATGPTGGNGGSGIVIIRYSLGVAA